MTYTSLSFSLYVCYKSGIKTVSTNSTHFYLSLSADHAIVLFRSLSLLLSWSRWSREWLGTHLGTKELTPFFIQPIFQTKRLTLPKLICYNFGVLPNYRNIVVRIRLLWSSGIEIGSKTRRSVVQTNPSSHRKLWQHYVKLVKLKGKTNGCWTGADVINKFLSSIAVICWN